MSTIEEYEKEAPLLSPILCSIPHAAAAIGRGTTFIYEAVAAGQIEAVKSNKRTLIVVESLRSYARKLPRATIKPLANRRHATADQKKIAPPRKRKPKRERERLDAGSAVA
jgi:hypothetical protein